MDPVGGGVTSFPPSEIVLDSTNDRVLAASDVNGGASLVAVDLNTGDRTYVSSAEEEEVGNGPLRTARGIVLDPSDPFAYVVDPSLAGIVKVDLRDGDRTTLTGCDSLSPSGVDCDDGTIVGEGPEMRGHHAAYHAASNSILVADRDLMAIFAVDLDTGDRSIISQEGVRGEGEGFAIPTEVAVDPESGRIFVGDNHGGEIFEVDQSTGDRSLVSGKARPPGGR